MQEPYDKPSYDESDTKYFGEPAVLDQSLLAVLVGGTGTLAFLSLLLKFKRGNAKPDPEGEDLSSSYIGKKLPVKQNVDIVPHTDVSINAIQTAKEEIKRLTLERDIVSMGLRSVYEAEAKGAINRKTKDQMLEKLKADLKRLDEDISSRKKLTEAFDLKMEREQLTSRLREIDKRLVQFDSAGAQIQTPNHHDTNLVLEDKQAEAQEKEISVENHDEDRVKTRLRVDERIDAIRADVLQAIERLERMEAEG